MGTRAIISKNGEPFVATHWDGGVRNLGRGLVSVFTDEEIIQVASEHVIDSASIEIRRILYDARIKELAIRYNLSERAIKQGTRRGNIFSARDFPIGSIDDYGDYAEYQYDLRNGIWYARTLGGFWPTDSYGEWKDLTVWIEEEEE